MFGASGTAKASGLSRFNRFRGLICYPAVVCLQTTRGRKFSSSSQEIRLTVIVGNHLTASGTNAFVVPWVAHDVAQMQEAQPKTPSLPGLGQPNQKIGDFFVLITHKRAVAITGLADHKGVAS